MPRPSWSRSIVPGTALVLVGLVAGCSEDGSPLGPLTAPSQHAVAVPPAALASVTAGGVSLSLWPYTGSDFAGTPQDPVNLVFTGQADPRAIRAALFALPGNRTAFGLPDAYPFNCTWRDAIGDIQTGYGEVAGWVGSAIQLACGEYGPVRFHLRLFEAGPATLGAAHFELLVPGTTDHQVLSWELAEQLVTIDFVRSGFLAEAPGSTGPINAAPTFREIPDVIYNDMPEELKAAIGGPSGHVGAPVGIGTSGAATVLAIGQPATIVPGRAEQRFVIGFDQIIPRPFCATTPGEYLRVEGPVELRKSVQVDPAGALTSEFHASGRLRLTPVNPATGAPSGPAYEAEVKDQQTTRFDDGGGQVSWLVMQKELPQDVDGRGTKSIRLQVGPAGVTAYDADVVCR